MMYLEVRAAEVRCFLDHSAHRPDRYSFAQVLAGDLDNEVGSVFGPPVLAELKATVRAMVKDAS